MRKAPRTMKYRATFAAGLGGQYRHVKDHRSASDASLREAAMGWTVIDLEPIPQYSVLADYYAQRAG